MKISDNQVLQMNDVFFSTGAATITISKENMHYKFMSLLEENSTKIPSGHGSCNVIIKIEVPKEDLLKLHRLQLEMKHSPFIYVENQMIRDEIVPHWSYDQKMAFSVLSSNIESVPGTVGMMTFYAQLQWFNYFPYMKNFTFREDWLTTPHLVNGFVVQKSIFDHYEKTDLDPLEYEPPLLFTGNYHALFPMNLGMSPAQEVLSPTQSKVYCRFFNFLQAQALKDNFNITLEDFELLELNKGHTDLETLLIEQKKLDSVIYQMMAHDYLEIEYNIFKFIEVPEAYKQALGTKLNDAVVAASKIAEALPVSADEQFLLDNVLQYNKILSEANPVLKSEASVILTRMINGENLSGRKYDKKKMLVSSVWRRDDTKTTGHYHSRFINNNTSPDSFAFDINYMEASSVGNHFDLRIEDKRSLETLKSLGLSIYDADIITKINDVFNKGGLSNDVKMLLTSILDAVADKYMFFADFGYVIQTLAKEKNIVGKLNWGGDFRSDFGSGHDHMEEELKITNNIFDYTYIKYFSNITNNLGRVPSKDELRTLLYPKRSGRAGTDHLHCEISKEYAESSTDYSDVSYQLDIAPFYNAYAELGKLSESEISQSEDWNNFEHNIFTLIKEGWAAWPSPDVNGVFYKTLRYVLPSSTGVHKMYPGGEVEYRFNAEPLPDSVRSNHYLDGSDRDLDTVFTKFSISSRNIINALPILSSNYPTHQRLGTLDTSYQFELMTQNRMDRSTLGKRAREIKLIHESLMANSRELRTVYDSWMCKINTFATRFTGDYLTSKSSVFKSKKQVINSTNTYTIPSYPGLMGLNISVESSSPYLAEKLVSTKLNDKLVMESLYKKIIEKVKTNSYPSLVSDFNPIKWEPNFAKYSLISNPTLRPDIPTLAYNPNYDRDKYTPEQQKKIESAFWQIRNVMSMANSIMNEEFNYPVKLYGLETKYYKPSQAAMINYLIRNSSIMMFTFIATALTVYTEEAKGKALSVSESVNNLTLAYTDTFKYLNPNTRIPSTLVTAFSSICTFLMTGYVSVTNGLSLAWEYFWFKDSIDEGGLDWLIRSIYATCYFVSRIAFYLGDNVYQTEFNGANQMDLNVKHMLDLYSRYDASKFVIPAGLCLALGSEIGILNSSFIFTETTLGAISPLLQKIFGDEFTLAKDTQYGIFESISLTLDHMANESYSTNISTSVFEKNKAKLIESLLVENLNDILNDSFLCEYFNIDLTQSLMQSNTVDSSPIFDIYVPAHPNTGKQKDVNPDFYYFNLYDDQGFLDNLKDDYAASLDQIVDNISGFTKAQKAGAYNAGLMSGSYSASEVAPRFDGDERQASPEFSNFVKTEQAITGKVSAIGFNEEKQDKIKMGDRINGPGFITDEIKEIEAQFGKAEGYLDEREQMDTIFETRDSKTKYFHAYNPDDIKKIAKEALSDVFSKKRSMIRTMPSYRLYIIEEDQVNDFTLKYDDFRHYNAIDSITYVSNKNIAADVAILTLKNISGILDGTKRLSISDVDYLKDNKNPDGSLTSKGKEIEAGREKANQETAAEEPFTSVQLRPGTNVQLRMGYGNDPDLLEVKLSGRVVEISTSRNHEVIDVMIQSFAVELEQQPKGLGEVSSEYNLTHKLLGSLMLSPELVHFGRVEKDWVPQFGENKSSGLDFKNYESSAIIDYTRLGYMFNRSWNGIKTLVSWRTLAAFSPALVFGLGGVATGAGYINYNLIPLGIANLWDMSMWSLEMIGNNMTLIPGYIWNSRYNPWQTFKKQTFEWIETIVPTPADDNLFPPNPKDYLLAPNALYYIVKESIKKGTDLPWSYFPFGMLGAYTHNVLSKWHALESNPRMELEDLQYIPYGNTIFQIFNEMTYRHPGFAYGARPYGNELRYTMFFGNPSQRYWSRGAPSLLIKELNRTRLGANRLLSGPEVIKEEGFNMGTIMEMSASYFRTVGQNVKYSFNPFLAGMGYLTASTMDDYLKYLNSLNTPWEPYKNPDSIDINFNKLLDYYKVLTYRFVPFRRYHTVTSDLDIISNNITLTDYNISNALSVKYYNYDSIAQEEQLEGNLLVKAHPRINDSDLKIKELDFPNCRGPKMAFRYGVAGLMNEVRNAYDGSLLILGNARINPWDIVLLYDKYNDMAGPIEVEEVIHKISFQEGYITEIKPQAFVMGNEISSLPIMEAVKQVVSSVMYHSEKTPLIGTAKDKYEEELKSGEPDFMDETGISKFIIKDPNFSPSAALATTFNSGCFLLGGYLYYLSASTKDPIMVYPLIKNGMPYITGFPLGMKDTLLSIFMGNIQNIQKDIEKGTIHFLDYWSELGLDGIKMVGNSLRNYNVNKAIRSTQ